MRRLFLLLFFLGSLNALSAQITRTLSDTARISLLTASAGEELYSTFGHSAIRVYDPANRIDRCYNYGTFDFDQPNFYLNFCRGKLLYSLDVESYRGFKLEYEQEHRTVWEQTLNLDYNQRQRLFSLLEVNARPENRNYKYEFFYDNCATRIRDIVGKTFYENLKYDSTHLPLGMTMRELLHTKLHSLPWTRFGMDLILGIPTDKVARPTDFMFLPQYMHDIFASTAISDSSRLVVAESVNPNPPFEEPVFQPGFLDRPLWVLTLVALIGFAAMFNRRTDRIFFTIFWFVLGVAGLIIFLLWFATDHSSTKYNLNMFWALPTHLFLFWRSKATRYYQVTGILAVLILLSWMFLPQTLPLDALPIVVLVAVKSLWKPGFQGKVQV